MAAYIDIAVIGVPYEAVAPSLQFLVHFIEQYIGQQRREGSALWRTLLAPADQATIHNAAVKIRSDQPDYGGIGDTRSEEQRVGKEGVRTCRSRGSPNN